MEKQSQDEKTEAIKDSPLCRGILFAMKQTGKKEVTVAYLAYHMHKEVYEKSEEERLLNIDGNGLDLWKECKLELKANLDSMVALGVLAKRLDHSRKLYANVYWEV